LDNYRNPIVSIGLTIADIIISLALFFIIFSFSRFICYVIVMNENTDPLSSDRLIIQEVLSKGLQNARPYLTARQANFGTAILLNRARSEDDLARLSRHLTSLQMNSLIDPGRYTGLSFGLQRICMVTPSPEGNYRAFSDTVNLVENLLPADAANIEQTKELIRSEMFSVYLNRIESEDDCNFNVISIRKSLRARDLIASAGFFNSYLASLERTLFNGYEIVGFKLSNYVFFDPQEEMNSFLVSTDKMALTTFLGASPPDPDSVSALADLDRGTSRGTPLVRVPFSPLMSSSLTTSIFLIFYLLTVLIAQLRTLLAKVVGHI
jgi:hypothetical protein